MDLLEYQGKQLFSKPGSPCPMEGTQPRSQRRSRAPRSSATRWSIKAQVQIGGRGKAGGIKLAKDRAEAEEHAEGDPRDGHPRPDRARALRGAGLRHRGGVLRGDRLRPRSQEADGDAVEDGRHGRGGDRRGGPHGDVQAPCGPPDRLPGLPRPSPGLRGRDRGRRDPPGGRHARPAVRDVRGRGRHAGRGEPAARDRLPRRRGARRQGHARRQRPLPPPGLGRVPQHLGRGPAGAHGQGARPRPTSRSTETSGSSATAPAS